MTTQQLIQAQVESYAECERYVLVTDYAAANVGTWRLLSEDDYACMGEITFNFQYGRMTFECVSIKTHWKSHDADQACGWLYEVVSAKA